MRSLVSLAGDAEIQKQLLNGVLRNSGHAYRGANAVAFDQSANNLDLLVPRRAVHELNVLQFAVQSRVFLD